MPVDQELKDVARDALHSLVMKRILIDVTDAAVFDKIKDAFIYGIEVGGKFATKEFANAIEKGLPND